MTAGHKLKDMKEDRQQSVHRTQRQKVERTDGDSGRDSKINKRTRQNGHFRSRNGLRETARQDGSTSM